MRPTHTRAPAEPGATPGLRLAAIVAWLAAILLAVSTFGPLVGGFDDCFHPVTERLVSGGRLYRLAERFMEDVAAGREPDCRGAILYPPVAALVVIPFGRLDLPEARALWFTFNLAVLTGALLVATRAVAPRGYRLLASGAIALAIASFGSLRYSLATGQLEPAILLLVSGAWALMYPPASPAAPAARGRRDRAGGLLVGLAGMIKLYPPFIVPLLLLAGRPWAVVGSVMAAATAWLVASVAFGWSVLPDFLGVLSAAGSGPWAAMPYDMGPLGFLSRAFTETRYAQPWVVLPRELVVLAGAGWSIAVLGAAGLLLRRRGGRSSPLLPLLISGLALLLYPYSASEYLVLLLSGIPMTGWWLVGRLRDRGLGAPAIAGLLAAPLVAVALATAAHAVLPGRPALIVTVTLAVLCGGLIHMAWGHLEHSPAERELVSAALGLYVLIAAPALGNASAWWGSDLFGVRILVGEIQFVVVVAFVAVIASLYWRPSIDLRTRLEPR